jgi:hypothetical protein
MSELIIVHEQDSGDPILLNRNAIVHGREYKQHTKKGTATSLELVGGKSLIVQESLETLRAR